MPANIRIVAAAGVGLAMLSACDPRSSSDGIAAAPGAPVAAPTATPAPTQVYSADPSKTGQAYADELARDPALYEKQKQLCNGLGGDLQPTSELEGPCWAWETARLKLEAQRFDRENPIKNTNSL